MCTMGTRPPGMGRSQPLSPRPPGDTNRERGPGESSTAKKKVRGRVVYGRRVCFLYQRRLLFLYQRRLSGVEHQRGPVLSPHEIEEGRALPC